MAYNDMFGAADEMAPQLEQEAQYQRILRALGYDRPAVAPAMEPSRGFKLGPVNVPAWLLDSIASGVAETPMPNNLKGGSNLAAGFAQGFASQRMGQNATRRAAYEEAQKRAEAQNASAERFKQAAGLQMLRARTEAPGKPERRIPLTPKLRAQLKANGIFVADELTDIPEQSAIRDMPQRAPGTDAADAAEMDDLASGIASFTVKPTDIPKRDPVKYARTINRANALLKAQGSKYNVQQLEQLWTNTQKWMNTSNAQRAVNTRKAAMTVLDHMQQFEQTFGKYREAYDNLPFVKKQELRLTNKGLYAAAKNGLLGPEAAADAAAMETIVSILPTEYATVLSGGFAPQKEQLEDAAKVFSPALGPEGHKGRMAAIKRLVKARVDNEQRNFSMIGGKDNPYLMEISRLEGWDLDKPLPVEDGAASASGKTDAQRFLEQGGRK